MRIRSIPLTATIVVAVLLALPSTGRSWSHWQSRVLYRFAGGADGALPENVLTGDSSGALYGMTVGGGGCSINIPFGCGTVFKLTPPASGSGAWTETLLHAFASGADGMFPAGGLVADTVGSLYGVTQRGGAADAGTIFKLTRTGRGAYSESVLYTFAGRADGRYPSSTLTMDAAGNLFGETESGGLGFGTIYELAMPRPAAAARVRPRALRGPISIVPHRIVSPPEPESAAWRLETLYAFTNANGDGVSPNGGLISDATGTLYGVTGGGGVSANSYGTVFKMVPPGRGATAWTERVIYAFRSSAEGHAPVGPLLPGSHGKLFGTTAEGGVNCGNGFGGNGCGTIFELTPPAPGTSRWTEHVLFSFGQWFGGTKFGPGYLNGSLVADARGRLYGTAADGGTSGRGAVFRIEPPAAGYAYTETDLVDFTNGTDGAGPQAGLYDRGGSTLYGTTQTGGDGSGTVYELTFS